MAMKPELIRPLHKYKDNENKIYKIINFDVKTKAGKVQEGIITWRIGDDEKTKTDTIFEFAKIIDEEIPKE